MPQLDILTFLDQSILILVIFWLFYYQMRVYLLPLINSIIKLRGFILFNFKQKIVFKRSLVNYIIKSGIVSFSNFYYFYENSIKLMKNFIKLYFYYYYYLCKFFYIFGTKEDYIDFLFIKLYVISILRNTIMLIELNKKYEF